MCFTNDCTDREVFSVGVPQVWGFHLSRTKDLEVFRGHAGPLSSTLLETRGLGEAVVEGVTGGQTRGSPGGLALFLHSGLE